MNNYDPKVRRAQYLSNRENRLATLAEKRRQDPDGAKLYERDQYEKHKENRRARDHDRYERTKHKFAAKKSVQHLVEQGELLPAAAYPCALCGNQARDYHHPSYLPDDHLNVVPLCRSCHVKMHHRPELTLPGGVVALKVGLVRIAIAGIE